MESRGVKRDRLHAQMGAGPRAATRRTTSADGERHTGSVVALHPVPPTNTTQTQVVQLPDTYLQSMHIWYIWDRAADRVLAKHNELVAAGWPANTTVVLDLPCPFLSIM